MFLKIEIQFKDFMQNYSIGLKFKVEKNINPKNLRSRRTSI